VTDDEIKAVVAGAIHKIAPEIDLDQVDPSVDLREQVDLDSMDILNLAIAIHEATRVDIPESDYPQMVTLNGAIGYLRSRINRA
jgi:acyl carrier protein